MLRSGWSLLLTVWPWSSAWLPLGSEFPGVCSHLIFPQDKEANSGKVEEKEGQADSDRKGQENPGEDEAGSKDEDSETDYSSEDEEILTKAGRPMHLGSVGGCAVFVLEPAGPHGAGIC